MSAASRLARLRPLDLALALLLLLGFSIGAASRAGAAVVYHSVADDGVAPVGVPTVPANSASTLFLYIDGGPGGSAPGSACFDGAGDEICGYELSISGAGGLTITGFTADPGADVLSNLVAGVLTLNGLDASAPTAGPKRIGTVQVSAGAAGDATLDAGEAVGADLTSETLATTPLATVPEPSIALQLIAGLAGLFALARRTRGRRASAGGTRAVAILGLFGVLALGGPTASAAPLIVNEFNAVASGEFLNGGTLAVDADGNSVNPPADTYFGRIAGNGGDWIELAVVADHLDIRGWKLVICENAGTDCSTELVFSNDAVWSDLRAGTLLTVAEDQPTDLSFDPGGGDWWMNVQATNGGPGTYITPSNFPVNHTDWWVSIHDDQDQLVFGPLGEHVPEDPGAGCFPPQDDVNSGEIFRLEQDPNALIDPCYVTVNDWEDGVISTFGSENQWNGGLATQSFAKLRALQPLPDVDGDQIPDDGDFSGIAGDHPCVGGNTTGCDDNCGAIRNADQADNGGAGGPDGQGDLCQCGDPTGDALVTADDLLEMRQVRLGLLPSHTLPGRCSVYSDGQCSLVDLVVLARALADPGDPPGLAPTCLAARVPTDQTELLFDPNRVLEVDIRISQADWDTLRFQENSIFDLFLTPDCGSEPWNDPYTFFPADVTVDGELLPNTGVRKKGFQGSLSTTEPSFKVKFDEFVGGQQFLGLDRITLNNNKQDPANVKQCISYGILRKAGIPAPRCNFAHVTVTRLDPGNVETVVVDKLYTHVESIKDPFLRRNFGSDTDQGQLFEGTLSDFWSGEWQNTIALKVSDPNPPLAGTIPEIAALTAALEDGGLSDAQRLAAIEAVVDVDDFLTFWAGEGMISHWDGYVDDQNNFWFYLDPADGLFRFIPWGTDDTLGRGNPLRGGDPTHADAIVPRSALARRLYAIPAVRAAYLQRLQVMLDVVFDEAELHAEIDRMETLIQPFTGNLTTQLAPIRTWVDAHRALVQAEIDSPPAGFGGQPSHFCNAFFP